MEIFLLSHVRIADHYSGTHIKQRSGDTETLKPLKYRHKRATRIRWVFSLQMFDSSIGVVVHQAQVCNLDFMLKSYAKIRLFPPAKSVDAHWEQ